jgi:hypothetical protein
MHHTNESDSILRARMGSGLFLCRKEHRIGNNEYATSHPTKLTASFSNPVSKSNAAGFDYFIAVHSFG